MKNLIYIVLIAVVVLTTACSDFLEEIPRDSISPANFYKSAVDAEAAVNGAYAALQDVGYYSRYWVTSSTHASDGSFTRLGNTSDRSVIIQLRDEGMITSNRYNISIWKAVYQAINRANSVLDHVPDVDMDATNKERVLGEAKFLRALSYFNMVRRWGGVPLILTETNTSNLVDLQVPNNTVDEIYQQIIIDLTDAVASLPNIGDYTGDDIGRASKEAAQGLLAKVQLYRKDWANAKTNALAVINSPSGLDLMPDPKDNYWQGNGSADNNIESIFEVQFNGNSPQGHVLGNNYEPRGSGWGPGAWGSITGSLYWMNQFEETDKRKAATWLMERPMASDPSTIIPWQDFVIPAPHINKLRDPDNKTDMAYNIKVLRLADVLLVAAEAINESEGPAGAYQYVNKVRTRAGLPDLAGLSQEQLRDSIYVEFRKELCFEGQDYEELVRQGRLLEQKTAYLTYTIPTLYDGAGNIVVPDQAKIDAINSFQPKLEWMELDAHNTIFPLPQDALDKNPNLKQNPGYPGAG